MAYFSSMSHHWLCDNGAVILTSRSKAYPNGVLITDYVEINNNNIMDHLEKVANTKLFERSRMNSTFTKVLSAGGWGKWYVFNELRNNRMIRLYLDEDFNNNRIIFSLFQSTVELEEYAPDLTYEKIGEYIVYNCRY